MTFDTIEKMVQYPSGNILLHSVLSPRDIQPQLINLRFCQFPANIVWNNGSHRAIEADRKAVDKLIEQYWTTRTFPACTAFYDGRIYWIANNPLTIGASRILGQNPPLIIYDGDERHARVFALTIGGASSSN